MPSERTAHLQRSLDRASFVEEIYNALTSINLFRATNTRTNIMTALAKYGILPDQILIAFNCFMKVAVDGATGTLTVLPPVSRAGGHIAFRAPMDPIIGVTACSAPVSNGGTFNPIHYRKESYLAGALYLSRRWI